MRFFLRITLFLLLACFSVTVVAQTRSKSKSGVKAKKRKTTIYGTCSYYAQKFEGRKTASGEIFRHSKYTAACNALPLGTWVKVTNLANKKTVIVKTNDRLHTKTTRLLDLTSAGARKLGFTKKGLTRVKIEVLPGKNYVNK